MIDTFSIRCNLLRFAFSGKLAEQREADGNARNLLSRISGKKDIEQTENTPYEIPESWAWAKLVDLYQINPKVEADDTTEAAFIPMERISAGFGRTFSFERQSWAQASRNHTKFADGDVAFAKISPCFENRKSFLAQGLPNGIGGGTTELIVLRQREMLPAYTYYLLLDQRFIVTGIASYKGTVGQQRVQSDVLKNFLVPVPPYPEQQRIVERIEQAFSALDTIDALQAQYADNLTVLKSKLIDAAIQGKLTEQLPEDGTAEELYQQIQAEKQALIKAGKIKKEKPLPEISADEIPFEIPMNWKWVRTGDIFSVGTGLTPLTNEKRFYENGRIPWVTSSLTSNRYIKNTTTYLSEYALEATSLRLHPKHTLIIAMYGEGKTRGQIAELLIPATTNQACATLDNIVYNQETVDYVFFFFTHNYVQLRSQAGGSNQPNLNLNKIKETLIPLPPLAEQKRIVVRLNELLTVCDEMKAVSIQRES